MTIEQLQKLSEASIDGAEEFDSIGYKKCMQLSNFLEDVNSDF